MKRILKEQVKKLRGISLNIPGVNDKLLKNKGCMLIQRRKQL